MKKINTVDIASKISMKTVFFLSLALLIISSVAYWKYVVNNPDRVFEAMLKNSLQTKSLTKTIGQEEQGDSNNQTIVLKFSPSVGVASKYDLQKGQGEQYVGTQTNVIGTKTADYIQYSKIESSQVSEAKKKDIVGVWAKVGDEKSGQKPSVFNDALFGVILFGDLGDNTASSIVSQLTSSDVYGIDKYSTTFSGGRLVGNFSIKLKPKNLVDSIKYYAQQTGYASAEGLGAEGVSNEPISLDITIDLVSRQVKEISFAGGQRIEKYGSFGQFNGITVPNNPISFSELSTRLQSTR